MGPGVIWPRAMPSMSMDLAHDAPRNNLVQHERQRNIAAAERKAVDANHHGGQIKEAPVQPKQCRQAQHQENSRAQARPPAHVAGVAAAGSARAGLVPE